MILRYILGCDFLYNKIIKLDTYKTYNQRVKTSTKKNNLWISTKWNHRYNIGIKPYMDYIDSSIYPTITATNETITHERVKTSSYMNESDNDS